MRRLSLQLFAPVVATFLAVLLASAFYATRGFQKVYVAALRDRLVREARFAAEALPWGLRGAELDQICQKRAQELGGRVTVIGADGQVLGESEEASEQLQNHIERPEIREASTTGLGTATRFSHTVGYEMLYVAIADRRDGERRYVRVALPLSALAESRALGWRILATGFAAAVLLGGGAAWLFSRRIATRIRAIEAFSQEILANGSDAVPVPDDDELGHLERHLAELAGSMRTNLARTEEERAKLDAVIRSMADGVVVLDREGRILISNQAAIEQLDLPAAGAVDAKLTFVCRHPELGALVDEVLSSPGASLQREMTFSDHEANRVVSVSGVSIADERSPLGAILVLRDMTRMKQFEAMRADFVANVSHELRTPLTAIRGYAETLAQGALENPETARRFLEVIQRHSERLSRLIDDLLSLSDLELGKTEIALREVSVPEVVEPPLEILKQKAADREIRLAVDLPASLPAVLADRDRIEQVLINLVDNAIKYSEPKSEVRVAARPIVFEDGRSGVEIRVADQGIGIPAKDIPRLTERFYRVDRARSRELGGTGLGLAIVKHIVLAHGGTLAIESEPHRGTTVRFVLPAASS